MIYSISVYPFNGDGTDLDKKHGGEMECNEGRMGAYIVWISGEEYGAHPLLYLHL